MNFITQVTSGQCPVCGSHCIEGGHVEVDTDVASQDIYCLSCDAGFTAVYVWSGHLLSREEYERSRAPHPVLSARGVFIRHLGALEGLPKNTEGLKSMFADLGADIVEGMRNKLPGHLAETMRVLGRTVELVASGPPEDWATKSLEAVTSASQILRNVALEVFANPLFHSLTAPGTQTEQTNDEA